MTYPHKRAETIVLQPAKPHVTRCDKRQRHRRCSGGSPYVLTAAFHHTRAISRSGFRAQHSSDSPDPAFEHPRVPTGKRVSLWAADVRPASHGGSVVRSQSGLHVSETIHIA
jgi:hypothetical protein